MASYDELKAMGIKRSTETRTYTRKQNNVATIIKALGICVAIIGIIAGLMTLEYLEGFSFAIIIASIISAIFVYSLGEIIQLLQDIRDK